MMDGNKPRASRSQVPIILTLVRWIFPKLERLSPWLAGYYFEKIFFTPIHYNAPEKEKQCAGKASLFSFAVGSKSIQGYSWGEEPKPYILLVHGWAGRATQFRKFINPALKAGYSVIGFDGPAHGKSEGNRTNIIEFEHALKKIIELHGSPAGVIAHSFGGGAALYAIMKGLAVNKLINIASPTISDEIIRTYLRAINGSWKTGLRFKELILKKYGRPFEEFTALHFAKHIPTSLQLMLVYDEDDRDVEIVHAYELIKVFPTSQLLATKGLGHTRILKDEEVICKCLDFIKRP